MDASAESGFTSDAKAAEGDRNTDICKHEMANTDPRKYQNTVGSQVVVLSALKVGTMDIPESGMTDSTGVGGSETRAVTSGQGQASSRPTVTSGQENTSSGPSVTSGQGNTFSGPSVKSGQGHASSVYQEVKDEPYVTRQADRPEAESPRAGPLRAGLEDSVSQEAGPEDNLSQDAGLEDNMSKEAGLEGVSGETEPHRARLDEGMAQEGIEGKELQESEATGTAHAQLAISEPEKVPESVAQTGAEVGPVERQPSLLSQISMFSLASHPWAEALDITRAESRGSDTPTPPRNAKHPVSGRPMSATTPLRTPLANAVTHPLSSSYSPSGPPFTPLHAPLPHGPGSPPTAHSSAPALWAANNQRSEVNLPQIKCSKYRIIGDPRLKRRGGHSYQTGGEPGQRAGQRSDQSGANMDKSWRTPRLVSLGTLPGNKHYAIDERTIYSGANQTLWGVIEDEREPLPPLEVSPRYRIYRPDGELLHERGIIMKDFFSMGRMRHFVRNKAIIPNVYQDFFSCPERKRTYVSGMYTETFKQPRDRSLPDCDRPKHGDPSLSCQYCDVMGNKYCSFCIERKNRHFAWGYEQTVSPVRPQKSPRARGPLNRSAITRISRSLDKLEVENTETNRQVQRDLAALSLSPRKPLLPKIGKVGAVGYKTKH